MPDTAETTKARVRTKYADIAASKSSSCCGDPNADTCLDMSERYDALDGYAAEADLGLGCGLPTELADLQPGERVIDLGAGGGLDAFVARRAVGETAPLIMIGALTFIAFLPETVMDPFTVLPIQIFNWTARPQQEFQDVAAAGIIVLMVFLMLMNLSAILLRNYFEKQVQR